MQPVFRTALLLALVAAASAACAADSMRKWTNPQGKSFQGKLVSVESGEARLELPNGSVVSVALEKFSDEDRRYLESRKTGGDSEVSTKTETPASDRKAASTDVAKAATIELKKNRKWSDRRGKQVTARFIRFHEGKAILMQGNKPVDVPFGDLSDADQAFLKERFEALGKADDVPPAIPTPTRDATSIAGGMTGATAPLWFGQGQSPPAAGPQNAPPNVANFPRSMPTPPRIEFPRPVTPPAFSRPQAAPSPAITQSQPATSPTVIASAPAFDPSASQSQQPIYQRQTQDISQPSTPSPRPSSRPFGSSFFDSQRTSEPPAAPDFSASPSIPLAGMPQQEEVFQCMTCKKVINKKVKLGDKCPHCGVTFTERVDESGKTVERENGLTNRQWGKLIGLGVVILFAVVGAIAKAMKGGS